MNSSTLNTAAGAFLGVVFVLFTVSIVSEGIFHSEAPEEPGFAIVAAESTGGDTAVAASDELAAIGPLLASADAAAGEKVFKKCAACHTVEPGGANKVGPALYDIVNRPIAVHEGFNYSTALKEYATTANTWTYENLNKFLHAPKKDVPGTAMGFAGLKKEDDRANLLAYLRQQAASPADLPSADAAPVEETAAPAEEAPTTEATAPTAEAPVDGEDTNGNN